MLRIRTAATIALAVLISLIDSASLSRAEDGSATILFQDSGDSFLKSSIAASATAPAWVNSVFDDERGDSKEELRSEERLRKLEESMMRFDSSRSRFEYAEEKKKLDAARKPSMKMGGRIQMDFWNFIDQSAGIGFFENSNPISADYGQAPQDLFEIRRLRLELEGKVPDNMIWRFQVDFGNPARPKIKDVYLGFTELPGNQTLYIGNQKRPLGLDTWNSSRFNVFVERPLVVEAFNLDARRPGICMYGVSDNKSIIWQYGAFYLDSVASSGQYRGDFRQMSINGRLAGSPWYDESTDGRGYFHWGIAGMAAKPDGDASTAASNSNQAHFSTRPEGRSQSDWYDTGAIAGAESFETIGLESILNIGPTQIVSEYQSTFTQRSGFGDTHFHGAYVYASWFLTGEHIPYDREKGTLGRVQPSENFFLADRRSGCPGTGWGAWNVAVRYSYLDLSDKDIVGGVGHAGTLALNWHWSAHAKLQSDLTYGQITDHNAVGGFTSGDYTFCGTRFAIDF